MAIDPLQSQPVIKLGEIVGYIEGAAAEPVVAVGNDDDPASVGDGLKADDEEEVVGLDGQFTIPILNAQRAFASVRCWIDPVGEALGDAVGL